MTDGEQSRDLAGRPRRVALRCWLGPVAPLLLAAAVAGGQATLSNREPYGCGAGANAYSDLSVDFRVIGAPVAYTLAGSLSQGGNPEMREGATSYVTLYRLSGGLISHHSSSTESVVAASGVLLAGEYVLHANAGLILDHDPDTDYSFAGAGGWSITFTLSPWTGG